MTVSVKQLRDNQNNFIYPKIAKEGLVEPINSNDVGISAINGIQSSTVQGALNELAGKNVEIVKKASASVISVSDSADYRLLGLKLYGKSVQDGVPTPAAPVEIESAGDSGNITVTLSDDAEQSQTLTYPTPNGLPGIPVESGGNYTDADGQQWICDEVDFASGKKIQRVGVINSYNSESVGEVYMSSTGQLTAGAKVLYPLTEPVETDLTPEQLTAYAALTTYKPNTTVTTDSDPAAGVEVKYLTDSGVSEVLDYYASKADLDGKQDKLTGNAGQIVGFNAAGSAEAQAKPAYTAAEVGAVPVTRTVNDKPLDADIELTAADVGAMATASGGTTGQYLRKTADGQAWQDGPDLSGYATQAWVGEQGYLTAVPDEYITEEELEAKGYALSSDLSGYVPTNRTINGKALSSNVTLAASDVGAALPAQTATVTLSSSGWVASGTRFAQTVSASIVKADSVVVVDVALSGSDPDADAEVLAAWSGPAACNVSQAAGSLTFYSAAAPTVNIPVLIGVV